MPKHTYEHMVKSAVVALKHRNGSSAAASVTALHFPIALSRTPLVGNVVGPLAGGFM